jgi:hypothetical protein
MRDDLSIAAVRWIEEDTSFCEKGGFSYESRYLLIRGCIYLEGLLFSFGKVTLFLG